MALSVYHVLKLGGEVSGEYENASLEEEADSEED